MNDIHEIKDKAILSGWIIGILILVSLIWIFSQSIQSLYLMRTVNNVLININDSRRVSDFIPQRNEKAGLFGYMFSIYNSEKKMYVFTVFQDGILVPIGAVISTDGIVEEIIPLSSHAQQIYSSLPKNMLQMYINKIEKNTEPGGR